MVENQHLTICAIIPVYNGAALIGESLESLYSQSSRPTEIIVADDASTDDTVAVVSDIAKHAPVPTQIISMPSNTGGPYGPASRAFEETCCDLVTILDADDIFESNAFKIYRAEFGADADRRIGLVTSSFRTFNSEGLSEETSLENRPAGSNPFPSGEDACTLSSHEAVEIQSHDFSLPFKGMVRRETWVELGGPDLTYSHACDIDFVWRLARHTSFSVRMLRKPLVRVRLSDTSMSNSRYHVACELVRLYKRMVVDLHGQKEAQDRVIHRLKRELFDLAYESRKSWRVASYIRAVLDSLLLSFDPAHRPALTIR